MALCPAGVRPAVTVGGLTTGEEEHGSQSEDAQENRKGLSVFEGKKLVHIEGAFKMMENNWMTRTAQ